MKYYFRYGTYIMYSGSKKEMEKLMTGIYNNCRKYYNIVSEQGLKEETWEF